MLDGTCFLRELNFLGFIYLATAYVVLSNIPAEFEVTSTFKNGSPSVY